MPFLIRRFVEDFWTVDGLCDFYVLFYFISVMAYILLPYDIIPEAVYGVFGLIDDLFLILLVLILVTRAAYARYSANYSTAPNSDPVPAALEQSAV